MSFLEPEALRRAAEKYLESIAKVEDANVQHELRVHQIELEMQNDALKKSQVALEASRDEYQELYEHAPIGYLMVSGEGMIRAINYTGANLLGGPKTLFIGQRFDRYVVEDKREQWNMLFARVRRNFELQTCELPFNRVDSSPFLARIHCNFNPSSSDWVRITLSDVTHRRRVEEQLRLTSSVFRHAQEGVIISDAQGNIMEVNGAFTELTGFSSKEVMGKNLRMLSSARTETDEYEQIFDALNTHQFWKGELHYQRKGGKVFIARHTNTAIVDEHGAVKQCIFLFSDVTTLREHAYQLEYLANHHALTGLPNRVLLVDRLQQALLKSTRLNQKLALVYLNIDGFKKVNEQHGRDSGDLVLKEVADNISSVLRDDDTLAHLGSDEFVVVLTGLQSLEEATPLLHRIIGAAAIPIEINDLAIAVSVSAGVTYYPQRLDVGPDQLLRQADQAMYQAKITGKNHFSTFDVELC